jgi:hypothetical protein
MASHSRHVKIIQAPIVALDYIRPEFCNPVGGDDDSPWLMLQRDPAAFADVGFVQIHKSGCVNELVIVPIAKRLVGFRRKNRGAIRNP